MRYSIYVFWLINMPSIKYVYNWAIGGGSSKLCKSAYRGWGLKNRSYDTYVLNGCPQTKFMEHFLSIGSAKYTRASPPARKTSSFSPL